MRKKLLILLIPLCIILYGYPRKIHARPGNPAVVEPRASITVAGYKPGTSNVVLKWMGNTGGVGGHGYGGFLIVDVREKKILHNIRDAYNFTIDHKILKKRGISREELDEFNNQASLGSGMKLKNLGYRTGKLEKASTDFTVTVRDKPEQPGSPSGYYECRFYLTHPATGFSFTVEKAKIFQSQPGGVTIKNTYVTPDKKGYLIFYRTPAIMEYDMGRDGVVLINSTDLSRFYNGVGFRYYKDDKYKQALQYFTRSIQFDPSYETAVYNAACMNGLTGDAEQAVYYLEELKALNTGRARQKLQKSKTDSDLDGIRDSSKFKAFVQSLR